MTATNLITISINNELVNVSLTVHRSKDDSIRIIIHNTLNYVEIPLQDNDVENLIEVLKERKNKQIFP